MIQWKNGKKFAAVVTVNYQAEYGAIAYHPDIELKGSEPEEAYTFGMANGTDRLLKLFEKYGIKATFFVPGIVCDDPKYRDLVAKIAEAGHEIGINGYSYKNLGFMSEEETKEDIRKSIECVKAVTGNTPVGFRAQGGELTLKTLEIAKNEGMKYSSSLNNSDRPYRNVINDTQDELLEIPMLWSMYDLPYYQYYFDPPMPYSQSRLANYKQVAFNWEQEMNYAQRMGNCLVLQLDPVVSGETSKLMVLDRFLKKLTEQDVWIAEMAEVAEYCEENKNDVEKIDYFLRQYFNPKA